MNMWLDSWHLDRLAGVSAQETAIERPALGWSRHREERKRRGDPAGRKALDHSWIASLCSQ
jgi:hypothetical protein